MDILKKLYPHAFKAKEVKDFIIALIIYIVIDAICGVVIGLAATILGGIPLIGGLLSAVLGALGGLVGLYAFIGIVLSILVFVKVLKD